MDSTPLQKQPPVFQLCLEHVQQGRPFPAEAYTSREFYNLEMKSIFRTSWVCIGVTHDVANPGDICPVSTGGISLLITRANDEKVRVFHNFCRHRGMRLADEPCNNLKKLMCPYHSWIYDLDGTLLKTPNIGGPGKSVTEELVHALPQGLNPVRSEIWHGLIFADISDSAPPFEEHINTLEQQWAEYDFSKLHWATGANYEASCNWKLAVENFIDVYHLPSVHQGLNSYSDYGDHYYVHEPGLYGEGNGDVHPDDIAVGKFDDFPGLPKSRNTTLEALALFPNLLITVTRDHLRVIIVDPVNPTSCKERVHIYVNGEESATSPQLASERKQLLDRFAEFNDEDLAITARLQSSMQSSFRYGLFSPAFDEAVRLFQRDVIQLLQQQ